jgi:hypothetical protein
MAKYPIDQYQFAKWPAEREQEPRCGGPIKLRDAYVCKECKKSVLAYKQPNKCKEHD